MLLVHLPDRYDAETVRDGLITAIGTLPDHLKRSLTWDQGAEMTHHHAFSIATGLPVSFCDPGAPWQRGSNEHTNGLLRQYFLKGTDLSVHSAEHLRDVAQELNGRPRTTLGWITPAAALDALLSAKQPLWCDDPENPRSVSEWRNLPSQQALTICLAPRRPAGPLGRFLQSRGALLAE